MGYGPSLRRDAMIAKIMGTTFVYNDFHRIVYACISISYYCCISYHSRIARWDHGCSTIARTHLFRGLPPAQLSRAAENLLIHATRRISAHSPDRNPLRLRCSSKRVAASNRPPPRTCSTSDSSPWKTMRRGLPSGWRPRRRALGHPRGTAQARMHQNHRRLHRTQAHGGAPLDAPAGGGLAPDGQHARTGALARGGND